MKSGENEEKHLGRLLTIYEEGMKNTKAGVPKKFGKYLNAYIWLKGEQKFGTHVLSPIGGILPDDIFMSGDISASKLESKYSMSKDSRKQ